MLNPTPTPQPTPTPHEQQLTKEPAAAPKVEMPTQDGVIDVVNAWQNLSAKTVNASDISHIAWWLDQFDRLTPDAIVQEITRLWNRQSEAGKPIANLRYFDEPLRQLHEQSKPSRVNGYVRGEGEPEPSGGDHVPPERVEELRGKLASIAAGKGL